MSAFLGPIHFWLYNKIMLENNMAEEVAKISNIKAELDQAYEAIENRPLEEMIDEGNIHGWLQEKVNLAENRLAFVLSKTAEEGHLPVDVRDAIRRFGGKMSSEVKINSVKDVYQVMNDLLLDGMPCDHVNSLVSEEENKIVVKRNQCIHAKYYVAEGVDVSVYYEARNAFMDGLLNFTPYIYRDDNGVYTVTTKNSVEIMMEEHQNILRMVKVVRAMCNELMNGAAVDLEKWGKVTDFIGTYADKHHHGKEEVIMFKVMEEELGQLGKNLIRHGMLVEHDFGRLYMHDLKEQLPELAAGKEELRLDVIANAVSYTHLIERHIKKEDELVYPFGLNKLSAESMAKVNEDTCKFEEEAYKNQVQDRYKALVSEMEAELYQ